MYEHDGLLFGFRMIDIPMSRTSALRNFSFLSNCVLGQGVDLLQSMEEKLGNMDSLRFTP